ncbi:SCO family protein [Pseudomonas saliphila]|uniref:SCO family protein n=1 Tax=Pseudomonas saliphila TaxID=2586906 RepID=UPI001F2FB6A2|nr:SCO family protein [Pseudomonas saliphila]
MQKTVVILLAIIALIVGVLVYNTTREPALDREVLSQAGIFLFDAPRNVPAIQLTSAEGEPWSRDDLTGQWDLLFFGYTYCPDICPTTMAELREIENQLPEDQAASLQITMISVDPNRDTPERMQEYLEYFSEDFNGASGDPEQLATLARALSIAYIEPDTSEENYLVDHSGQVVMINPEGQYVGFLRAPLRPAELSQWLPRIMAQ